MTHTASRQNDTGSKIAQIQNHYRTQIRRGTLVAGDRLPSERELASTFGVNLLTINKAMAVLESERLLDRQTSRGTYIHRDVSRGQIIVVFDTCHFANPDLSGFYHSLLASITTAVKNRNMRPMHILGHGDPGDDFIASLEPQSSFWHQCAGVLAMAGLEQFENQLLDMGVPAVTITTLHGQGIHPVRMDYDDFVMRTYKHLRERGCQRIGIIFNNPLSNTHSVLPGLKERVLQSGDGLDPRFWIDACATPQEGYQAMTHLWQQPQRPDGLVIVDDNTAMGVGKAVRDLGINTPGQLKLITQSTEGVTREFPIDFTRCQFSMKRLCTAAFGLLYRLMLNEKQDRQVILKATIHQGATT